MKSLTTLALIAACALAAPSLQAQQQPKPKSQPSYKREVPDSLLAKVKISEDSARAIALRHVGGGTIEALELEYENGILVYSWDIKMPGKSGITEVQVSAIDGKVVATEHEDH
jgi:uncharacterized membrane protein YkoI